MMDIIALYPIFYPEWWMLDDGCQLDDGYHSTVSNILSRMVDVGRWMSAR